MPRPAARVSSVVACAKLSAVMAEFSREMQSMDQQQSLLPTEVDHSIRCCLLFSGSACLQLYLEEEEPDLDLLHLVICWWERCHIFHSSVYSPSPLYPLAFI